MNCKTNNSFIHTVYHRNITITRHHTSTLSIKYIYLSSKTSISIHTPSSEHSSEESAITTSEVAAIVAGVIVPMALFVILLICICYVCIYRRKRKYTLTADQSEHLSIHYKLADGSTSYEEPVDAIISRKHRVSASPLRSASSFERSYREEFRNRMVSHIV